MPQRQVNLQWEYTDVHDHQIAGFKILQSNTLGGPYTEVYNKVIDRSTLGSGIETFSQTIDVNVPYGPVDFYWVVKAYNDAGDETDASNEVTKGFNLVFPNPNNLIIVP